MVNFKSVAVILSRLALVKGTVTVVGSLMGGRATLAWFSQWAFVVGS